MIIIYDTCIRFNLEEKNSFDLHFIYRYDFEQWREHDKNVTDQTLIDQYENMYQHWLKKQQVVK